MRFALVEGKKTEATKGVKGYCPGCGSEVIAKFYKEKIDHWAHKGNRDCDHWWEPETEWHRAWKSHFPIDWQEVPVPDDSGNKKHRADVKTKEGWVLEFQHSYMKHEERLKRNAFYYPKLVWIIDGLRRKTDIKQFQKMEKESVLVSKEPLILDVSFPDGCILLKEWHVNNAYVFFDFKGESLWFLFPRRSNSRTYLAIFSRAELIRLHNSNKFGEFVKNIVQPIHDTLIENEQEIRTQTKKNLAQLAQQKLHLQPRRNQSYRRPKRSRWSRRNRRL